MKNITAQSSALKIGTAIATAKDTISDNKLLEIVLGSTKSNALAVSPEIQKAPEKEERQ